MKRSARHGFALAALLSVAGLLGLSGARGASGASAESAPASAASPAITFRRLPGSRPQSAALLASANEGGVLPLRLSVLRESALPGSLEINLETPGQALFAGVEAARATIEVTLYATSPAGDVLAALSTAISIDRARPGVEAGPAALRIFDRLAIPSGATALRALLYCRESGAFALRRVDLPAAGGEAVASGAEFVPAAGWIDVPLSAPRRVAGSAIAAAPAPAAVSALPAAPPAAAASLPPAALTAEGEVADLDQLETALRAVYRQAATGDREGAVQQLIHLERTVGGKDPKRGLARLERATSRVTAAVAGNDPGLLLVLALLHQQTGLTQRQLRQTGLAQRNEELAMLLLERMAKESPRSTDRGLAATALAGLALPYLERSAFPRAGTLLDRALVVGGDDAARLIALAAVRMQEGDSRAARALLERALAVSPGSREAALRRGIADAAEGADARAERELSRLCAGRESDWIAILACQESARKALGRRQFAAAAQILERALARWPDDPTLILALAYTQRNLDRRTAAAELSLRALALAASSSATAGAAASPRQRFVLGPRAYLVTQRYAAEQAAAFRAPPLLAALGGAAAAKADSR